MALVCAAGYVVRFRLYCVLEFQIILTFTVYPLATQPLLFKKSRHGKDPNMTIDMKTIARKYSYMFSFHWSSSKRYPAYCVSNEYGIRRTNVKTKLNNKILFDLT